MYSSMYIFIFGAASLRRKSRGASSEETERPELPSSRKIDICLSIYRCFNLSVHVSHYLYTYLHSHLPTHPSIHLHIHIYTKLYTYAIYPTLYLSKSIYLYQSKSIYSFRYIHSIPLAPPRYSTQKSRGVYYISILISIYLSIFLSITRSIYSYIYIYTQYTFDAASLQIRIYTELYTFTIYRCSYLYLYLYLSISIYI